MVTAKDDPQSADQATHGSGIRNADHGTGSDRQQLRRGMKKIPIELNTDKPPAPGKPASKPD